MGWELSLQACIDYAVSGGLTFNLSSFIRGTIITTGAFGKKKVCWRANKFLRGWALFADLSVVTESNFSGQERYWKNDGQTPVVNAQTPQARLQQPTWTAPTLPQLYTYSHAGAPGVRTGNYHLPYHLSPLDRFYNNMIVLHSLHRKVQHIRRYGGNFGVQL